MRGAVLAGLVLLAGLLSGLAAAQDPDAIRTERSPIIWRPSKALGEPFDGRLVNGVQLPPAGKDYLTWDPVLERSPNRGWRRWGTDRLLRVVLRVTRQFRAAHRAAPRLLVGDLSRPRGGDFGRRFGGIGHASHQNGLDVDVYFPRRDRRELAPRRPSQVDLRLAQDLVNRFVRAGAEYVFVGPATPLRGPRRVVQPLVHHDDHIHVRLYNPRR
jgi:murein endopeptidase